MKRKKRQSENPSARVRDKSQPVGLSGQGENKKRVKVQDTKSRIIK